MKKPDSIVIILAIVSAALSAALPPRGYGGPCYAVSGKDVVLYRDDAVKRIPAGGTIIASCAGASGVYYCAESEEKAGGIRLGFVDFTTAAIGHEMALPLDPSARSIARMMAGEGAVYLLTMPDGERERTGELLRINDVNGEISRVTGVLDFHVTGVYCCILMKTGAGQSLVMNETVVPISLRGGGAFVIRHVLDERLVFVAAGGETEVIDMRAGKSLYQYAGDREFLVPDGYNLLVQAVDSGTAGLDDRETIFYKVYVDGVETGRTDSGPAVLVRESKTMLEPNRYHSIRLERWVLNSGKGRYDRENNIRQPKMQQIYIPMNRIVKLTIYFSNNKYTFDTAPVFK